MAVGWVDVEDVKTWMGDSSADVSDALGACLDAAVSYVLTDACSPTRRPDLWPIVDPGDGGDPVATFTPDPLIVQAVVMLAARWYQRRSSVLGTTGGGYPDMGTAQILQYDPDVARMLKLGKFAPFGFGAPTPVVDPAASLL